MICVDYVSVMWPLPTTVSATWSLMANFVVLVFNSLYNL